MILIALLYSGRSAVEVSTREATAFSPLFSSCAIETIFGPMQTAKHVPCEATLFMEEYIGGGNRKRETRLAEEAVGRRRHARSCTARFEVRGLSFAPNTSISPELNLEARLPKAKGKASVLSSSHASAVKAPHAGHRNLVLLVNKSCIFAVNMRCCARAVSRITGEKKNFTCQSSGAFRNIQPPGRALR